MGAALAVSSRCTLPLVLVSLGISGAWVSNLTALQPFRPVFMGLAVGLLGFAAWRHYEEDQRPQTTRVLLGVGGLLVVALLFSPYLLPASSTAGRTTAFTPPPTQVQEVVLRIEGMTCSSCATTVGTALKQLDGVLEAQVSYDPAQALVRYDAARVSVTALTAATARAGYPSTPLSDQVQP
jgi:mercuric transport protein